MNGGADRRGFTLIEVMVATIILSLGLAVLLTSFANCQRVMRQSQDYETAQYVLALGETVHPIPSPDLVTGDPIDDEQLNIEETTAEELLDALDLGTEQEPVPVRLVVLLKVVWPELVLPDHLGDQAAPDGRRFASRASASPRSWVAVCTSSARPSSSTISTRNRIPS